MIYRYKGQTKSGKIIKSRLEADNLDSARNSLRAAGYTVIDIKPAQNGRLINRVFSMGQPTDRDMEVFCRQASSLLEAGATVAATLGFLCKTRAPSRLISALEDILSDIEKGRSLADSMAKHKGIFPDIMVGSVAVGEKTNNLSASFSRMEMYFKRRHKNKSRIANALVYPLILLAAMTAVVAILLTVVIPSISDVLTGLDTDLPAVTKAVIAASDFTTANFPLILASAAALIFFFAALSKTNAGSRFFSYLKIRLPLISKFTELSYSSEFCRTMSLALSSGMSLIGALELTANDINNYYYKKSVMSVIEMVTNGISVRDAIILAGLFPTVIADMAGVGNNSDEIVKLFLGLANYYEEETDAASERLAAALEPVVTLVISFFVAVIVFAVFLPIISVNDALSALAFIK